MTSSASRTLAAALVVAACGLAGCQSGPAVTGSTLDQPSDVRSRHPIVLGNEPRTLDVFVTGPGHVDPRQRDDIGAFALEYRRYGRGAFAVQMPQGTNGGTAAASARTLSGIRRIVAENGLPAGSIAVSGYPVTDPSLASVVRLSFQRMQAKVAGECGLWPQDLGAGDWETGIQNQAYWNFGCAMQANVAAQIADPVDLVRGRQEGRIDTIRRAKVIEDVRSGKDPSIPWRQDGQSSVKQQVGQ